MLGKFREEREKAKLASSSAPAATTGTSSAPPGSSSRDRGGDYRASRGGVDDRDRDRDRGYERHSSSRYELVSHFFHLLSFVPDDLWPCLSSTDRRRDRERSRSPGRRRY